jgi:hypothetical protein
VAHHVHPALADGVSSSMKRCRAFSRPA